MSRAAHLAVRRLRQIAWSAALAALLAAVLDATSDAVLAAAVVGAMRGPRRVLPCGRLALQGICQSI